jgi:hypothetical protein
MVMRPISIVPIFVYFAEVNNQQQKLFYDVWRRTDTQKPTKKVDTIYLFNNYITLSTSAKSACFFGAPVRPQIILYFIFIYMISANFVVSQPFDHSANSQTFNLMT